MLNFCPGCGGSIDQNQVGGQAVTCIHCGRLIGVATEGPRKVVVDQTDELIKGGTVARCSLCQQAVQLKSSGQVNTFRSPLRGRGTQDVSQQRQAAPAVPSAPAPRAPGLRSTADPATATLPTVQTPGGKDLSKYYSRELIRVVACSKGQDATIEELALQYLDKTDRVRTQIEALRDILGPSFRMKDYPPALARPHLALWSNATRCVVAKKHPQGGYQPTADEELIQVVEISGRMKGCSYE